MQFSLEDWIGLAALLVTVVGVYHAREQTKMMRAQTGARPEPKSVPWWRSRHVVALVALTALAWSAAAFDYFATRQGPANELSPLVDFWGVKFPSTFYMLVDTSKLAEFRNKERLVLVLRGMRSDVDRMTDPAISKSAAFTITGDAVTIAVNKPKIWLVPGAQNFVEFNLVLLPNQFSPEQITTLSDVARLGGKILANTATDFVQAPKPSTVSASHTNP